MRQTVVALVAIGLAISAHAYPTVSSDPNNVQLNVWNTNLAQAKLKAKALNRPALLVMLDSLNCSYSSGWITRIADAQQWQTFLAANPLILIMADKTKVDPTTWSKYTAPYREAATGLLYFPTVVLFRPDGTVADQFIARSTLGSDPGFYTRVKNTTVQYPFTGTPPGASAPGTVGFALASVTVSEGVSSLAVSVTRQGGSSGAQTFSYATVDGTARAGVNYTAASGSLVWADGDASSKTVSVRLINDNRWTSPTARALTIRLARTSGTATLGTAAQTVTINEVTAPAPVSQAPVFTAPGAGATVSAYLNVGFALQAQVTSATAVSYSAAGLPAGLAINAGTGLIAGTPTAAGTSAVTVTARNSTGPATTAFTLKVLVQSAGAAGTYQGFFYGGDAQTVRGTLTLTATSAGRLAGLAVLNGLSESVRGTWLPGAAYTANLQTRSGGVLSVAVDAMGNLTGTFKDAALFGKRVALSGVPQFTGYYTSVLGVTDVTPNSDSVDNQPQGSGFVTFTVSTRGTVKYSGVLADGARFSGSSVLTVYDGAELADLGYADVADGQTYACFPLYKTLYSRRGVVAAQIWIDGQLSPLPADNRVFIAGSEWVYPGRSSSLTADGFAATFDDGEFAEIGAAFAQPQDLAGTFEGASLQLDCGTVDVLASGLSLSLPSGNALGAGLTASRTTGLFSGRFLLEPESGARPYRVQYSGVLVPALGLGAGYYLETDTSFSGYRIPRSKAVLIAP